MSKSFLLLLAITLSCTKPLYEGPRLGCSEVANISFHCCQIYEVDGKPVMHKVNTYYQLLPGSHSMTILFEELNEVKKKSLLLQLLPGRTYEIRPIEVKDITENLRVKEKWELYSGL